MFDARLFKDQVAVITGGGTGIGLAIARRLGSLGARIAIASRNAEHLESGCASLRAAGIDPLVAQLDVRKPEQVDDMVLRTVKHFGSLDMLVNNAAGNFVCRAEDLSPNGWNAVIDIVLNGTFYCSSAVGKRMIEKKTGGVMLNVIANYAWTGGPGVVHSASAKAGVLALTRTLAVEWARHKIRVNAIAPGPVHTPGASERLFPSEEIAEGIRKTIPLRRFANLQEVAQAASYLLSDYASYVTGENFVIDGGQWLSGADYFTRLKQMMPR